MAGVHKVTYYKFTTVLEDFRCSKFYLLANKIAYVESY